MLSWQYFKWNKEDVLSKHTGGGTSVDNHATVQLTGVRKKTKSKAAEYFEAIILALILALFIRTFIVQAFKIPSPSMVPTLLVGDHILVNKFLYGFRVPFTGGRVLEFRAPARGEVIVFKYPRNRKLDFIKRCVAVGGDTVEIRDKQLYVNGQAVPDTHAYFSDPTSRARLIQGRDDFGPITVPKGKLFMMGDNRDNSNDSRFWGFVDEGDVRGKAIFIYWSWDKVRHRPRFSRIGDGVK